MKPFEFHAELFDVRELGGKVMISRDPEDPDDRCQRAE
jgi:hypothetical protein